MHPTLAGFYPFLLGSPARCAFLSYLCVYICLGSPAKSRLSRSAVALTSIASGNCHGLCLVTFFPKNNHRMALTEPPTMATSPLFSATLTTSQPHRTYIGPPSEFILYSATTSKSSFLSLPLQPAPHTIYCSTTRAPQCSTYVPCCRPCWILF